MHADHRAFIAGRARRQLGLVTHRDLRDAGLSQNQIDHVLRTHELRRVRHLVYALAGVPPSWRQEVLAVALSADAVASHATAGRLFGYELPGPELIEVTSARTRRARIDGVQVHRSLAIPARDVTRVSHVPSTSAERLVVDMSARMSADALLDLATDLWRLGSLGPRRLRGCLGRLEKAPGRRPKVVHEVLRALESRPGPGDSDPELVLYDALVAAGESPQLGVVVEGPGFRYTLDVAFAAEMVGFEYDSWAFHGVRSRSFHGDRQKSRKLQGVGWAVIPVTARTPIAELVDEALALLEQRRRLFGFPA